MGLSVAASSAILFTGFLFVATVLIAVLSSSVLDIQESIKQAQDRQMESSQTNIRVDNATNDTSTVFVNVTNTGSNVLKVDELNVLINGTLMTENITKHSVGGSATTNLWGPDEILYLELDFKPESGAKVRIVTGNGVGDSEVLT